MGKDLIVKENRLITSKYHLTKTQTKFIAYMSSKINKDDIDFFTYDFKLNETLELLGIDDKNYLNVRKSLRKLMTTYLVIAEDETTIEETTFLSYFKINKIENTLSVRFDKSLKPFLLKIVKNFTKLSLSKILKFDSSYTIRFYEILEERISQYKIYENRNLLEFEYELQDLKEMLVGEYNEDTEKIEIKKSYQRFNNFKNKIIDVAYHELKEKGDYYFEYEAQKTGRRYTSIKFKIIKNGKKIKEDFKKKQRDMLLTGKEKNIAMEQIRRIIERKGNSIKDKLKYEQKLFQLYLRGELKYDKDLEAIRKDLEEKELNKILNQK